MLDRNDVEPILGIISAENIKVRMAGLEAITRFDLTEDAWRTIGPSLRGVLAETPQGSAQRGEAIQLAARAPLASVRSEVMSISAAPGDPDAVTARRVLGRFSPADVDRLVQQLKDHPVDSGAASELAALPVESLGNGDPLRRALTKRLRGLTRSRSSDVRLWAALALARLGYLRALDKFLNGQDEPSLFGGSPWTAYDRLAELRPIPDQLHAHLMGWLARHPHPDRERGILAWALTGSADAQGLPVTSDDAATVSDSAAEPDALTSQTGRSGEKPGTTVSEPVEQVVTALLNDPFEASPLWRSLTTEQAVAVMMHVFRRLAGDETADPAEATAGQADVTSGPAGAQPPELPFGFGNVLVDFASGLPAPTELPVREIYQLYPRISPQAGITPGQISWILSRSDPAYLTEQFSQDLPDMGPQEQIYALQMLGQAGDFQRGAPAPYAGAGPGDAAPPLVPATLINDLGPGPSQLPGPGVAPEATSTAWAQLDAPAAVVVGQSFDVEVGLGERRDPALDGTGALILPAADFTLGVELLIDGFAIVTGDRIFTLDITAQDRYPKQTVTLVAVAGPELAERRRIGVLFRVGREMRGYAGREIAVKATRSQAAAVQPVAKRGGSAGIDTTPFKAPGAADLTVIIQYGDVSNGSRLLWSAASPHIDIPLPDIPLGPLVDPPPERFLNELVAEQSSTDDVLDGFASLRGQGKALIARLMPGFVQDALRSVAQAVGPRPPTVLLLSQDPYVPWEFAVLDPPLPGWPADRSPFLGAQAIIGRWVLEIEPPPAVDPPKHVTVRDEVVVAAVYEEVPDWPRLESAEHEAAELRKKWPAAHPVGATLAAVLRCVEGAPEADIIHFALHGEFSTETARQGVVLIGTVAGHPDQRRPVFLKPSHIDGGKLTRSPLVFLNACQVGANRLVLGNYSGMASAFVRVGASAVVAPLWSVDDEVASALALDFYARVLDADEPPAEVLRANRARVTESAIEDRARDVSGTHLAYQFFGHPNLRLAMPAATQPGKP